MKHPLKWSALLAVLLFAFSTLGGASVAAQEEGDFQPGDLEGIQYAVARSYTIDYSAMMTSMATPGAELTMPSGLLGLNAMVIEFDNDGNAEKAVDRLTEQFESSDDFSDEEVETFDLGVGNKNTSYSGTEEMDGAKTQLAVSVVQEGNFVYILAATGMDIDAQDTVKQFAQKLIDNDGSGEGEFNEDGTSTGGIWDKFPGTDDELIANLIPFDAIVYPEPEGSDA